MIKSFGFITIVALLVAGVGMIPDYDKYKAGGYKESVNCEGNKVVCWWVKLEYKEKKYGML